MRLPTRSSLRSAEREIRFLDYSRGDRFACAEVVAEPDDVDARARMQLGAAFAGSAIENSMLGAAHSAANPLTAHHGIVHGQAVGVVLPGIIRFNAKNPEVKA